MVSRLSDSVLAIDVEAVARVSGDDALCGLWNVFTKCKDSLQDGPRLENIAWRLWHREIFLRNSLSEDSDDDDVLLCPPLGSDGGPLEPISSDSESDGDTVVEEDELTPELLTNISPLVRPPSRSHSQSHSRTISHTANSSSHASDLPQAQPLGPYPASHPSDAPTSSRLVLDAHHRTNSAPHRLSGSSHRKNSPTRSGVNIGHIISTLLPDKVDLGTARSPRSEPPPSPGAAESISGPSCSNSNAELARTSSSSHSERSEPVFEDSSAPYLPTSRIVFSTDSPHSASPSSSPEQRTSNPTLVFTHPTPRPTPPATPSRTSTLSMTQVAGHIADSKNIIRNSEAERPQLLAVPLTAGSSTPQPPPTNYSSAFLRQVKRQPPRLPPKLLASPFSQPVDAPQASSDSKSLNGTDAVSTTDPNNHDASGGASSGTASEQNSKTARKIFFIQRSPPGEDRFTDAGSSASSDAVPSPAAAVKRDLAGLTNVPRETTLATSLAPTVSASNAVVPETNGLEILPISSSTAPAPSLPHPVVVPTSATTAILNGSLETKRNVDRGNNGFSGLGETAVPSQIVPPASTVPVTSSPGKVLNSSITIGEQVPDHTEHGSLATTLPPPPRASSSSPSSSRSQNQPQPPQQSQIQPTEHVQDQPSTQTTSAARKGKEPIRGTATGVNRAMHGHGARTHSRNGSGFGRATRGSSTALAEKKAGGGASGRPSLSRKTSSTANVAALAGGGGVGAMTSTTKKKVARQSSTHSVQSAEGSKSPGSSTHRAFVSSPLSTGGLSLLSDEQHHGGRAASSGSSKKRAAKSAAVSRPPPTEPAPAKLQASPVRRPYLPGRSRTVTNIAKLGVASTSRPQQNQQQHQQQQQQRPPQPQTQQTNGQRGGAPSTKRRLVTDVVSSDFETTSDEEGSSMWSSAEDEDLEAEAIAAAATAAEEEETGHIAREAALEAARQRDMFRKVPSRSYSNLGQRRQSGLLSSLMHPDQALLPYLPANSQGGPAYGIQGLGRPHNSAQNLGRRPPPLGPLGALQPMTGLPQPVGPPTPGPLKPSKSAAEVRVAAVSVTSQVAVNPSGRPGFRLKGRPEGQDVETDDEDEETDGGNVGGIDGLSKSMAQRQLEQLAAAEKARRSNRIQQHQERTPTELPPQFQTRQRSEDFYPFSDEHQGRQAHLTRTESMPVPLPHPYNLPAPAPPQTPRTTRRQMMANEMSESLRRNLLWERQLSRRMLGGFSRIHSSSRHDDGGQPGLSRSGDHVKERDQRALARNKSWANEYHAAGW